MGRKRNMPSRSEIFEYWKFKLSNAKNNNTCFRCGITSIFNDSVVVDRAHILAVCENGSDDVSNLHLLCRSCHRESEVYSGKEYKLWINSRNKEDFAKSLFVLWDRNELRNTSLDKYFNKVKSDFIENTSKIFYNYQIESYAEESKNNLNNYYNDLKQYHKEGI